MVLQDSLEILILEIVNFGVNMVFLALFIYRFVVLSSFSKTQRYKNYFPKMRIFFSIVYVVINIALLIETLVFRKIYENGLDIMLIVLGEGIDCVIIIIQLFVLRLELMKEQPYTWFHIAYFIYLVLFSVTRLIIFKLLVDNSSVLSIVLSCILIVDSLAQLTYWIFKKQSLPQFQVPTNAEIDALKDPSIFIQNNYENVQKSFRKDSKDYFPYIIPFVLVESGKIKLILQIKSNSHNQQQMDDLKTPNRLNPRIIGKEPSTSQSRQILISSYFSIQEIKNLYIVCSRFPLTKQMNFNLLNVSSQEMARELQQFLIEVFRQKRYYQPNVLKYFKLPLQNLKQYNQLMQKYSDSNKETELDLTLGVKLDYDKNSIFYSINIYKHLWVYDHYEFYIKIEGKFSKQIFYPIKRFSEFQDFHARLKHQIRLLGNNLMLPDLPKKHLFHWDEDQEINQRRSELQRYLRILYNDHTILSVPVIKELLFAYLGIEDEIQAQGAFQQNFYNDLRIVKGDIKKSLIKKDFVTYYQFKLFQKGIQVGVICKRFSQFEEMNNEFQRWMNNTQITYKAVLLPEKRLYYKSQSDRHEKLKNYLQKIVEIRDIGRVYAVNSFFNVSGNSQESDISQIINSVSNSHAKQVATSPKENVNNEIIELTNKIYNPRLSQSSESSARRFSQIMNNLGED